MVMLRGNGLGLLMVVVSALVALVGGLLLRLPDPVVMGAVGITVLMMDLVVRLRGRSRAQPQSAWLTGKTTGGYLFFIPAWLFGIVIILINVINALQMGNS